MGHARWKGGVGDRRQQRLGCVDRTPVRGRGGALSSLYSDDAAAAQHSYLAPAPATAPAVRRRKIRVRSKASPPRSMPPRAASTSWSTMRTPPGLSHMPICAPSTMISSTLCWRSIWRGPSPRCALAGHCLRRPGRGFLAVHRDPSLSPEEAAAKAGSPGSLDRYRDYADRADPAKLATRRIRSPTYPLKEHRNVRDADLWPLCRSSL